MLFRYIFCLCMSLLLGACQPQVNAQQQAALQQQAASIVRQFVVTLKPQLKQALQHGGPAHAIAVCSKLAPALAIQLSEKSGWQIKRVSLKARHHPDAIPDSWERSVLLQFDRDQQAGAAASTLVASDVRNGVFHYMKAQPVVPVCLLCHGTDLQPDVIAALKQFYPKDQATGYSLGQIRGTFSLSKSI